MSLRCSRRHKHTLAFLRAWRRRETSEGRASVRAWLYRIATNACLDALDKRPRRPTANGEVAWLQPYPDGVLEQLPTGVRALRTWRRQRDR